MTTETIDNVVIEADLFALARSEQYQTLETFRAAAIERWKEVAAGRVDACIELLSERLWNADYWNFRTDYLMARPRKHKALLSEEVQPV